MSAPREANVNKIVINMIIAMIVISAMFVVACNQQANKTNDRKSISLAPEKASQKIDTNNMGEEVSVHVVHALKGQSNVIVLDVRTEREYKNEHISGVTHIVMNDVKNRLSEISEFEIIFVTCRSGNRSGQITRSLLEMGHTGVHNMSGGIIAWKKSGYQVE